MKTILVSGASGIVGYGTLKSLRMSGEAYKLVGTTIYDDSIAPAFCDVFELAPLTTSDTYLDWLCGVIKKHQIDLIIPAINEDMLLWNEHREEIEKTGAKVLLNNPELVDLCADKWLFYEKLQEHKSPYAIESRLVGAFSELKEAYGLPFILKPRRGYGSKGLVVVDSEETFTAHAQDLGHVLMAQPLISDNEHEYTISAFFDTDSNLCCFMGLRRKLAKEGFTEKAEVSLPPRTEQVLRDLAAIMHPVGPTNFQFRLDDGKLCLLEINPRISSATSIRSAFGYNESVMSVAYFLDGKLPTQPTVRQGHAVRYVEDGIFYDSPAV